MGLEFDGVDDSISVTEYSDIALSGSSVFTISVWIKSDSLASQKTVNIKQITSSGQWRYGIYVLASGKIKMCTSQSCVGTTALNSTGSIGTTQWHHIVAICNSGQKLILDNETPVTTSQRTGTNAGNPLYIGSLTGTSQFFDGKIAEYGMWVGVELTANEITALFKGAKPSSIRPASLKAYLPMHLKDSSGNTNNESPNVTRNDGVVTGALNSNHAPVRTNISYYGQGSE